MKNLRIKFLTLGLAAFLVCGSMVYFSSCTKDFEELNTDKTKLTTLTKTEYPYLFSKALSSSSYAFWRYQVAQNLFADLYSQYYATSATYFPSDRLVIRMDWMRWHWTPIYTESVPQLKTLLDQTDKASAENALAKIWWVYTFHRVTDYYGPIPYFKAGEPGKSVAYDAQDKIYDDFFVKLNEAVTTLKGKTSDKPYGSFDLIYKGDVNKWIKFANTLRLRLALRISKVNPAKAKTEAEAAVSGGVMTDFSDDALMAKAQDGSDFNGLSGISVWNEFRMSASMESVLKGYDDPRIGIFFQPASATGTFEGLRNGLSPAQLGIAANSNDNNSNVGERWVRGKGSAWSGQNTTPQDILHASESYLLRSEGALNGWAMGGTAQEMYEKGIETSMKQWGIADAAKISAYVASAKTPIAPADQQASPALSNIPVKWGSSVAIQREQIGTQKWLAVFPDGIEAWAEFRRTRFPKLYPTVNSENADIPQGQFLRRIPFIDFEKNTNKEAVNAAAALLGGADKASTPLWWDKN
jgi:Susd and RagB outer membrane lipoprotein